MAETAFNTEVVIMTAVLTIVIAVTAGVVLLPSQQRSLIVVNPNLKFQTIVGWEATTQVGYPDFSDWDIYKNALMDRAAADGINRLRLEIQINNENTVDNAKSAVNDNNDPFNINWAGFKFTNKNSLLGAKKIEAANMLRSRLAANGEPMPYTVLCYVDFASREGLPFYHHDHPEEYAELIEAAFLTIEKNGGWVPDAVEIILEPDNGWNDLWTAAKVANCLLSTQKRLAKHNWHPRFIIPSVTNCPNGAPWYSNIKKANPAVLAYVDEFSYHRYGQCTDTVLAENQMTAELDGKRLAMTEFIGATYEQLHKDLKANAVAWAQYALAYDDKDNGAHYYRIDHEKHQVTISSRMKFLRQYFKYIRRGAVRIDATTNNASFDPVAFTNTNGKQVVIVKAESGGSFEIQGLSPGTYGIKYTTTSEYDVDERSVTIGVGQAVPASIPAAGVITIYGTSDSRPRTVSTGVNRAAR